MSTYHVEQLRAVDTQRKSVTASLAFVVDNWERQNLRSEMPGLTPEDFRQAQTELDTTYFVRLYAEFEGLLKDHLLTNHPSIALPRKPKVDDVLAAVVKAEAFAIETPLRVRLNAVRDYRNSIAHASLGSAPSVRFVDALSALNAFVARLPAPSK